MSERIESWQEYGARLVAIEELALEPVVPGELATWCRPVGRALEAAASAWPRTSTSGGGPLADILEDDPKLVHRVEGLERDAERLFEELAALRARVARLLELDELSGTESAEQLDKGEELRERLLSWVVGARAHAREIDSWRQEALYRDRGVAD